jgi:ribosomal protein RSM22 (predicted rRNA methylase)
MTLIQSQRAFGPFVLSIDEIRPHLLNPRLKESELVKHIIDMSMKFTVKRDKIYDYVMDENAVSAYTAFYLPTNIPKLHFLLSKLSDETLIDISSRPFIDIGCGPGTYSLAMSLLFQKSPSEIIAVDSSKLMLEQTIKLLNGFFPDVNLALVQKFHQKKSDSVLFFGHSINELGGTKALDLIATVDPEYVMWIEPATSDFFIELKKMRESLTAHFDILYPCPSSMSCPSSWCHQVLRTTHDLSLERLSQLVSLDRKILPIATMVMKRKKSETELNKPVITRYLNETKFSFEYEVCLHESGENKNKVIEIQKRQLSKDEEKFFKNSDVGERVDFEVEKTIGEKLRVKLK